MTALREGEVVITAKVSETDEGSSLTLTVLPRPVDPESVTIEAAKTTLNAYQAAGNDTVTLTATVLPAKAPQSVIWSSSDETVAKVSSDGIVTALKAGTATITATSTQVATVKNTVEITVIDERFLLDKGVMTDIDASFYTTNGKLVLPEKNAAGDTVTALKDGLLKENTTITELELPAGLKAIPASLCEGCTALTKVTAPNTVETIGAAAFKGCTSLSEMVTK